jgi:YjbE family integral membrane protein
VRRTVDKVVLTSVEFWFRLAAIVVIDLALAGDNALVIALAVGRLSGRQRWLGQVWGTLGAVVLRVLSIAGVTWLLKIPLLQLLGGAVLLVIAFFLVGSKQRTEALVRPGTTLLHVIGTIMLADVVMSLDNVLAVAAAARGDVALITFGIALSLPLVVWGSGALALLMDRHHWTVWLAGGVLGYVSGEMMIKDPLFQAWLAPWISSPLHHGLPVACAVGIAGLGWCFARARAHPDGRPKAVYRPS